MSRRFGLGRLFNTKKLKFLNVGILNTLFSYFIYAALLFFKVPYIFALFISTIAGVIFNYITYGRLVFNNNGSWMVFGKFVCTYSIIYIVNIILLSFLISDLLINPYLGQALCIPISVLLSWLLMNYWVYKND
jgi:putative flippase GtrA